MLDFTAIGEGVCLMLGELEVVVLNQDLQDQLHDSIPLS
jgi:hypothetical protein